METGWANATCCQPPPVSAVNVAVARRWPAAVQRLPECVPVLPAPLKKRTPVTKPAMSERNFTPTSIEPVSDVAAVAGCASEDQIVHGHVGTPIVVNDHVNGALIGVPFSPE